MTEMTPGEELRAAADHIREHHGPAHPRYGFWREVAGWLNSEAERAQVYEVRSGREFNRALNAARAYLGSAGAPDRHGGQHASHAETWRPIPGHKGYEASSLGRVRSVPRTITDGREHGGVILSPTPDRDGYLRVKLGRRTVGVHVAVCLAFHGPPEVRHLNGDRQDNRPENLAWGSRSENERDKKEQKRRQRERGEGKES